MIKNYSNGNSKKKYKHSATGTTALWWECSPHYNFGGHFCVVNYNGNDDNDSARDVFDLAPAFQV